MPETAPPPSDPALDLQALEPCPFCGGDAEMDTQQGYTNYFNGRPETGIAIYCRDCGVQQMICRGDVPDIEPEAVIEMWNRRALATRSAPPAEAEAPVPEDVGALVEELLKPVQNVRGHGDHLIHFDTPAPEVQRRAATALETLARQKADALARVEAAERERDELKYRNADLRAKLERAEGILRQFERDEEDGEWPVAARSGEQILLVSVPFKIVQAARAYFQQESGADRAFTQDEGAGG